MIRVLQCVTGNFDVGGLSQIVYRWGEKLSHEGIIFDYHCRNYYEDNEYTDNIRKNGGMISYPDRCLSGIRKEIDFHKRLEELINTNHYGIVHIHADTSYNMIKGAITAKKCGVKRIILHSHSAGIDRHSLNDFSIKYLIRIILHKFLRILLPLLGDDYCACSEKAAEWMFCGGIKKVHLIENAIDVEKYKFNETIRIKKRFEERIANRIVAGHVGRFVYQKNHRYIVKIAKYAQTKFPQMVFVLVGDGELFGDIEKLAVDHGVRNIIFVGRSKEVEKWMQAFDVFILPSHFEGLPVVGIEAQAAGLPCVFSKNIDYGSKVADDVLFLSIDEQEIHKWCEAIVRLNDSSRINNYQKVVKSNFNIQNSIMKISSLYVSVK
jgi:glycosyltransferase involved in cell wall biosynthesis